MAIALRTMRELAGRSIEEWAAEWTAALGKHEGAISPDLVRAWEREGGPKPMAHVALVAFWLAGPAAGPVLSSLLLT